MENLTTVLIVDDEKSIVESLTGIVTDEGYSSVSAESGEQALEITENLIRSGAIDIIVVDSVAALVPRSEIEGEMGDSKMGLQARLMSQAMRKLTGSIGRTGCSVLSRWSGCKPSLFRPRPGG